MSELNERIRIMHYAKELKLSVFRDELEDYINMGISKGWDSVTLMCEMFSKEIEKRTDNRKRQRIKAAQFPQMKYLQDLERDELPPDARATLPSLETLEFIREGRNIVMYGNPGTGKTHIATALGIKACEAGYSVLFTTVPRLLTHIREAKHERTLKNLEARFEKYDMVICDEFGYVSCDKEGGELLFNHLSLRAGKKTTIITTNLAFNRWDEIIKDKVLVTAMVDRLTHKAHLLNMTGKSYRAKETEKMLRFDFEKQ